MTRLPRITGETGAREAMAVMIVDADGEPVSANGVNLDAEDLAVREGRAFTVGSAITAIAAGNFFNYVFLNPANSGRNVFVTSRTFFNTRVSGDPPLEAGLVVSPVGTPPSARIPTNRRVGGMTSVVDFRSGAMSARLDSNPSTVNPQGYVLPTNGTALVLPMHFMVTPGSSFGFFIGGAGGGALSGNAVRVSALLNWYEEVI